MAKYTLKEGVILHPYGVNSLINNDNLTDSIAELLIKKGKATKNDFIIKQVKQTRKKTTNGNSK
ncbi:hypothetical protein [Polaribacter sp.]|uniref:hypothetical protein n=1 Tax=Polaribacter sp. TaxID=1920175 RepID=UPI003F6C9F81